MNLCHCGCGRQVKCFDRYGKPHKYFHGHHKNNIELIPCGCGCGELIKAFDHCYRPIKFKFGHWLPEWNIGRKPSNFKGEPFLNYAGYRFVWCPNHPRAHKGYVREHILVMEEYLTRIFGFQFYIPKGFVVHHKNGEKADNRLENLELLLDKQHRSHHAKKRKRDLYNQHFLSETDAIELASNCAS